MRHCQARPDAAAQIRGGPDDFRTQPAGASGVKIACGVITKN